MQVSQRTPHSTNRAAGNMLAVCILAVSMQIVLAGSVARASEMLALDCRGENYMLGKRLSDTFSVKIDVSLGFVELNHLRFEMTYIDEHDIWFGTRVGNIHQEGFINRVTGHLIAVVWVGDANRPTKIRDTALFVDAECDKAAPSS